jgi:hypothetical protein
MDLYLSRIAEVCGTIYVKSISTGDFAKQLRLRNKYHSNSLYREFLKEADDLSFRLFPLIPTSQHRVKLLPYSCLDFGLWLQYFQSFSIGCTQTSQELAADNSPVGKTRAAMWCSHENYSSCALEDALGVLIRATFGL